MGFPVVKYDCKDGDGSRWGVCRHGKVYPLKTRFSSHRQVMDSYFKFPGQFQSDLDDTPDS